MPRAMRSAIGAIESGANVAATLAGLEAEVIAAGFASVDYAVLADSVSLAPLAMLGTSPARLLVAARIGGTRLIDNMAVTPGGA
jgi:pantoate--beta-alanine ligase